MRLPYTDLWTTFRVTKPFWHPDQAGSLWRGVIGRSLRRASCMRAAFCVDPCAEPGRCAYSRLFEPSVPTPAPHRRLDGQQKAPPPLQFLFARGPGRLVEVGERIKVGVRCMGTLDAADTNLLSRTLAGLTSLPLGRDRGRVALLTQSPPQRAVLENEPLVVFPTHAELLRARIELVTPTWIEYEGKLHPALDFPILFTNTVQRISVLSALYGTWTAVDDVGESHLLTISEKVWTLRRNLHEWHFNRHSIEKDCRHPLHGLTGSLVVEGPLAPLMPYLRMAEAIGIGKSTSFGLGRLRITAEPVSPGAEAPEAAGDLPSNFARSI